jgi:hypothetical protein
MITNIRIEDDKMIAFYEFPNGSPCTQKFPFPTDMDLIIQWGEDKQLWFNQREQEMIASMAEMEAFRDRNAEEELLKLINQN